jgi:hypothetical protein
LHRPSVKGCLEPRHHRKRDRRGEGPAEGCLLAEGVRGRVACQPSRGGGEVGLGLVVKVLAPWWSGDADVRASALLGATAVTDCCVFAGLLGEVDRVT